MVFKYKKLLINLVYSNNHICNTGYIIIIKTEIEIL